MTNENKLIYHATMTIVSIMIVLVLLAAWCIVLSVENKEQEKRIKNLDSRLEGVEKLKLKSFFGQNFSCDHTKIENGSGQN